ncbi:MAG: hypothetical protein AAF458_23850 [Pseudomonadota bacterium]
MQAVQVWISLLMLAGLSGCTVVPVAQDQSTHGAACIGTTRLPDALAGAFTAVEDTALLQSALGAPDDGKLCQGQAYELRPAARVRVFRAFNSTNPNSRLGRWWVFDKPAGPVASYRARYEICYQWSALDKLVQCTLKPGARIVLGTGQSARCSEFLTYPVSEAQQIYVAEPAAVENCRDFEGVFSWQ